MTTKKLPIKIEKNRKKIIENLTSPVKYQIQDYFPGKNKLTGKNVKISILDSGYPNHKDIPSTKECISFIQSKTEDSFGHSTMISSIISGNNEKGIQGIAKNSKLMYGKVVDSKGEGDFNALVAGVLWSIVKEVDIIVIALGSEYNYTILHDAIKKASQHGICVFSAGGNNSKKKNTPEIYPSFYKEVFSTACLTRGEENNNIIKEKVNLCHPNKSFITAYKNNSYIQASGSSLSTALFAGIAACLIEEYKSKKIVKEKIPQEVYSSLTNKF